MSIVKIWYTLEEAASKFGVAPDTILEWVEVGVVRSEEKEGEPLRIDGEDLAMQIGEIPGP